MVTAYRHAAYDTPWWAFPSSRSGRFHRGRRDIAQYWCLHPLGPAAEVLRSNVGPNGDPDDVVLNLWSAIIDFDPAPVVVDFATAPSYGLSAVDLVADDHTKTQELADALRARGHTSLVVPSAALPGTYNLVLFGPRVLHPYLWRPISSQEVPTGHLSDSARPAAEVAGLTRWIGTPHAGLTEWETTGTMSLLQDPIAPRW